MVIAHILHIILMLLSKHKYKLDADIGVNSVIYSVNICLPYLYGEHFEVYKDHYRLRWLMFITDPSGSIVQCILRLIEYELHFHHKKGHLNNQADSQSQFNTQGHTIVHESNDIVRFISLTEDYNPV